MSVATLARALPATVAEHRTMPFPSVLLAAFSVACYARRTVVAIGGGLLPYAAVLIAVESDYYTGGGANASNLAILTLFLGGAWGAGWLVRQRAAQAVEPSLNRASSHEPPSVRSGRGSRASCTTWSRTASRSSPFKRVRPRS